MEDRVTSMANDLKRVSGGSRQGICAPAVPDTTLLEPAQPARDTAPADHDTTPANAVDSDSTPAVCDTSPVNSDSTPADPEISTSLNSTLTDLYLDDAPMSQISLPQDFQSAVATPIMSPTQSVSATPDETHTAVKMLRDLDVDPLSHALQIL